MLIPQTTPDQHPPTPIDDAEAGFHLIYSSGTTGRPKGVKLPLIGGKVADETMWVARNSRRYALTSDSVFLCPAPLYHSAPLLFSTTAHRMGSTVVVLPKFTPELTLEAIEKYRVTYTQMVPTMFVRMLRMQTGERLAYDVSSLDAVVHAAAPCPVHIKEQMMDWLGDIVHEYYGGSEANGSTAITPQEWRQRPGSVGRPDIGSIHVCNEAGDEQPPGEKGLVYFQGGFAFEYLNDPEKTQETRNPKNPDWTTIGDIGWVDEEGFLFLTDRKSFVIISGGVNIYPQEIEDVLMQHPKVVDVAVFGIPNEEFGEEVKAVVQPTDWDDATDTFRDELMSFCREKLSHVKCPRSLDFDRALPRQENGKLFKKKIRDEYWKKEPAA